MDVSGRSFESGIPPAQDMKKRPREGEQGEGPAKKARTMGPLADLHAVAADFKNATIYRITSILQDIAKDLIAEDVGQLQNLPPSKLSMLKTDIKFIRKHLEEKPSVLEEDKPTLYALIDNILGFIKQAKGEKMQIEDVPAELRAVADPTKVYIANLATQGHIAVKEGTLFFSDEIADTINDQFLNKILENVPFDLNKITYFDLDVARYPKLGIDSVAILLTHCKNLRPQSFKALSNPKFCDYTLVVEGIEIPVHRMFIKEKCPGFWQMLLEAVDVNARQVEIQVPMSAKEFKRCIHALIGVYDIAQERDVSVLTQLVNNAGWLDAYSVIKPIDAAIAEHLLQEMGNRTAEEMCPILRDVHHALGGHLSKTELPETSRTLDKIVPKVYKNWVSDRAAQEGLDVSGELSPEDTVRVLQIAKGAFDELRARGLTFRGLGIDYEERPHMDIARVDTSTVQAVIEFLEVLRQNLPDDLETQLGSCLFYLISSDPNKYAKIKDLIENVLSTHSEDTELCEDLANTLSSIFFTGGYGVDPDPERAIALLRPIAHDHVRMGNLAHMVHRSGRSDEALALVAEGQAEYYSKFIKKLQGQIVTVDVNDSIKDLIKVGRVSHYLMYTFINGDFTLPKVNSKEFRDLKARFRSRQCVNSCMMLPFEISMTKEVLDYFPPKAKAFYLKHFLDPSLFS